MHSVLVVDDDATSCNAMARLLSRLGDKATCVTSGEKALTYLQGHVPRLVILDVMMPDMDGFEVLTAIRADDRLDAMPVVMFTAMSDQQTMDKARSLGATDYWVKTAIDYARLQEMVAPYLSDVI